MPALRCYNAFKVIADPAWVDASLFLSRLNIYDRDAIDALVQAVHCCRKYKNSRILSKHYDARCCTVLRLSANGQYTNAKAVETLMNWFDEHEEANVLAYLTQQSGIAYRSWQVSDEF